MDLANTEPGQGVSSPNLSQGGYIKAFSRLPSVPVSVALSQQLKQRQLEKWIPKIAVRSLVELEYVAG